MHYIHEFAQGWAVVDDITGEKIKDGFATQEEAQKFMASLGAQGQSQ